MQHNKNTEFVMYVDNFLEKETLISLQNNLVSLDYKQVKNPKGDHYGMRHTFPKSFYDDPLLKLVKQYFFPHRDLKIQSVNAHIRNNTKEPLFHVDDQDYDTGGKLCANFLLFVNYPLMWVLLKIELCFLMEVKFGIVIYSLLEIVLKDIH